MYSVVLLHSFVPHFHGDEFSFTTDVSNISNNSDHTHCHNLDSHHHHGTDTINWFEELIDFVNHFNHQDLGYKHLDEYLLKEATKVNVSFDLVVPFISFTCLLSTIEVSRVENRFSHFELPPILYESCLISSYSHRGPPVA